MNLVVFVVAAVILYLLTSAALTARLAAGVSGFHVSRATVLLLGFGGLVLHGVVLYPELMTGRGLNMGFFNAASLVALLMVGLLLLVALRQPVENLGIPVLPIAAVTLILGFWNPGHHQDITSTNWQLDMHILFSVLAYSLFALAAVQALLLQCQDRHLRDRRPGGFVRALPPLEIMERLLFQMIGTGFALLTAALLTGFVFLQDIFAQHLVHKTVLSIISWVLFGILLWGRWKFGWRGRTAIRWTLSGFAFLILAYFGSKFVLELILHRNA
jgi:ABC-type uncharacterized transport system permease subunit